MKVEGRLSILGIPIPFVKREVPRNSKVPLDFKQIRYSDGASLARVTKWLDTNESGEVELFEIPITGHDLLEDVKQKGSMQPINTPEELNSMKLRTQGRIKSTFFRARPQ